MSWFDTSGLASLAKNALKEAQKTIDKALDIKDDDDGDLSSSPPIPSKLQHPSTLSSSTSTLSQHKQNEPSIENIQKLNMKHSVSNPTMSTTQINSNNNVWGSFSGSYFDNHTKIDPAAITAKTVIQSPPPPPAQSFKSMSGSDKNTTDTDSDGQPPVKRRDKSDNKDGQHHHHQQQQQQQHNRLSLVSDNNSESVEVLSTPTTPASSLASPCIGNNSKSMTLPQDSDSVEIIGIETPTSELFSPLSASIVPTSISTSVTELSKVSSQESLDSIKDDIDDDCERNDVAGGGVGAGGVIAIVDDELSLEDDSISYNTVTESMATIKDSNVNTMLSINPITIAPSRTALHLSLGQSIQNKPGIVEGDQQKLDINKSITSIKQQQQQSNSPVVIVESTSTSTDESGKIIPNLLEDAMLEKSTDNLEHQSQLSDSTQSFEDVHQTLLREQNNFLIDHQSMATHSSSSEEQSSDIIKIICNKNINVNSDQEQASGHTSGDDIETNTSSDIEIISSPNGDSSSTNSAYRSSPHKNINQNVMSKNLSTLANTMVVTKSTNKNTIHGDKTKIIGSNTPNITNCGVATTSAVSQNKKKGHFRESSETSIQSNTSSEDLQLTNLSVNEKLQRRISELSEILEAREFKLMTVGREMTALQDTYTELKLQLDTIKKNDGNNLEMTNVTDEYAQRMSALEKKFQQSIRERDQLRGQLKLMENDSAEKISKTECERLISEKQFIINELKLEGDKLSKQILQHSNIIKKLRTKEKENDTILKRQKDQIEELTDELERLKKSLSAKDDMERSQIEAIHKLSSERKRFERDNGLLKNQLDDLQQKLRTLQISFDVAKKEVNEKQQMHSELTKRTEILATLETENMQTQNQNHQIVNELKLLRDKLKQVDIETNTKEHQLRQANNELMHRLEEAELRAEQNVQSISESTIPLIRQCESLQSTLNARTLTWEKQEKQLLDKLHEQQAKLEKLTTCEKFTMEQQQQLQLRCSSLEERIAIALLQSEQSASDLQQKNVEFDLHTTDYKNEINVLKELNEKYSKQIIESNKKITDLEKQLQTERETYRLEKRRYQQEYESISSKTKFIGNSTNDRETNTIGNVEQNAMNYSRQSGSGIATDGGNTSPTLSIGHASIPDSLSSNVWPLDDIDCISNYGGIVGGVGGAGVNLIGRQIGGTGSGSIYGGSINFGPLSNTTSQLETLQSNLKQRDGENNYLHWEISKLKSTRDTLMEELGKCTTQIETYQEKLTENDGIIKQHTKLREEYDALLQMYGEKVEETQELKLDLQDVKDMYKTQIDDLLRQQRENRQPPIDS